jgi:hypothetical protein
LCHGARRNGTGKPATAAPSVRQQPPGNDLELVLRKVHTAESILEIAHLRNVLETDGIACVIRNDRLAGALGEIPFVECWPELWVVENAYLLRARELIAAAQAAGPIRSDAWICERCGEHQDAQFDECWRCAEPALETSKD